MLHQTPLPLSQFLFRPPGDLKTCNYQVIVFGECAAFRLFVVSGYGVGRNDDLGYLKVIVA